MSSNDLQRTTEGNKSTLTFPDQETPTLADASLPSVDGYNLAEFSLSPLGLKTKHLANSTIRHEWTQVLDGGEERLCFFEKEYGNVAPNGYTEDVLLVLTHLAHHSDNPLRIDTSLYEIHQLMGGTYHPNDQQNDQVVRHLDALYGMGLNTNFVYDLEEEEWKAVKTRVLGAYSYKDEEGKVRKRKVVVQEGKTEVIKEQIVKELKEVNFTSLFYRHFIKDSVPIDLGVYFALGVPTARRIYRFGNKYIQRFGHHALDLQLFCLSRIGMSPTYVEKYRPSTLASKVRPYAQRVTETEKVMVNVEKTSGTPSGYKITFDKPVLQMSLPSLGSSYTNAEEKAHELLIKQGLYPNVARAIVIECRRALGKEAPRYIKFVVRRFEQDYVKPEKLNVPKHKTPGVLKSFFDNDWYYPHFIEWQAKQEKKERQEEAERYPHQQLDFTTISSTLRDASSAAYRPSDNAESTSQPFSLKQFQQDHPAVYERIVDRVAPRYTQSEAKDLDLSDKQLAEMRDRAITVYCKQCFTEFQKGNSDFFPSALIETEAEG